MTLVASAKDGDASAAAILVERHWYELFRVADLILRDPIDAEDVVQEALISAFGSLGGFDTTRELRPWLVGITTNKAIDRARRRARERLVDPASLETRPAIDDQNAAVVDAELALAIEALDPETRAILVLRYVLDYRSGEIADMLETAPGTVRSRLKRALDSLRSSTTMEAP